MEKMIMSREDYHTYHEIKSQTLAWEQALNLVGMASLPKAVEYDQVLFTGCGSTYYLSLAAASLFQKLTGRTARAVPGGELFLNPETAVGQISDFSNKTLLVAVSRSGSTTETVRAVEQFKTHNHGLVVALTNYDDQPLADLADLPLVIEKGHEQSVAQTRSFSSMYVAAAAFCAKAAGRDDLFKTMAKLPEIGDWLIENYEPYAKEIGENLSFDRFYFLGSGIRYGLACEANLKMKEMTLTHSEPFHFLEFRHGPMSMVNSDTVVVGLLSDANRVHEAKVLSEMADLEATVVSLAESDADIAFGSGIPEEGRGVLYLPVLQLMAFYRSLAKGLNPDQPKNLTAVVMLE
jgi:glucosamine--fructose-6-phosphate aminotransferase (isomerizing)